MASLPLLMLVLQFFSRSELSFPILLQIPGDQSIFRLADMVLSLRSLGLVAGTFQSQLPLLLDAGIFLFHLLKRLQGDADLVRFESRQYLPLDLNVYFSRQNALTPRLAQFTCLFVTDVCGLFAPSAAILRPHPRPTLPAQRNPLEQCLSSASRPLFTGFKHISIGIQSFLIREILIPTDVAGIHILNTNFPLIDRHLHNT